MIIYRIKYVAIFIFIFLAISNPAQAIVFIDRADGKLDGKIKETKIKTPTEVIVDASKIDSPPGVAAVEKSTKAGGVDPDLIKDLIAVDVRFIEAVNYIGTSINIEKDYVEKLYKAIDSGQYEDVFVERFHATVQHVFNENKINLLSNPVKIYNHFSGDSGSLMSPVIIRINDDLDGEIVYYVNGMLTTKDKAIKEATALSQKLQKPVGLIYNSTSNIQNDLLESSYDRIWPLLPLPIKYHQANPTTRQVAYLFANTKERIRIVTHSQGCLIARNALLMANAMTNGKAKDNLSWVLTGPPLQKSEVFYWRDSYKYLCAENDLICKSVSFGESDSSYSKENYNKDHDFIGIYIPNIDNYLLGL